jgi:hypothetical protein
MIWANLIHLSYNMWIDRDAPELEGRTPVFTYRPHLRFDKSLWNDLLPIMAQNGVNMVVIDLGDAVEYASHPEIAVQGAWSIEQLRNELARARQLGIEPIPKLNFSTTHDAWLGPYSRMVSSPAYYDVCRDLITECIDIFESPRLFHLGMDEETFGHQKHHQYAVVRQYDLWWNDLMFYVGQVERKGARAWIWSDFIWHHKDEFVARMPKSVLQSNWYYGQDLNPETEPGLTYVGAYDDLEAAGYDQIPTGSNFSTPENFGNTVRACKDRIAPERLKGFLQTIWRPTIEAFRQRHIDAIEQIGRARTEFERA